MEKLTTIEHDIPLVNSAIWTMQKGLYQFHGPELWNHCIPSWATNNNNVANSTNKFIEAFIKDYEQQYQQTNWSIVIIGAGIGILPYKISTYLSAANKTRNCKIHLVISDCVNKNIDAWKRHPQLKPFIDEGTLVPIWLDADRGFNGLKNLSDFRSEHKIISPLIVIANYVFDSLPQSIYEIDNGKVSVGLCTIKERGDSKQNAASRNINDLITEIRFENLHSRYNPDPIIDSYIASHVADDHNGQILVPSVAMRCLANLKKLANDNIVLIATDKYLKPNHNTKFHSYMTDHGPIFSLPVDPYALVHVLANNYNSNWMSEQWSNPIMTVSHISLSEPLTLSAVTEIMQDAKLSDSAAYASNTLHSLLTPDKTLKNLKLSEILATFEKLEWDIEIIGLLPVEISNYFKPNPDLQPELNAALNKFSENIFIIPGQYSSAVILGFYAINNRQYTIAQKLFNLNIEVCGANAAAQLGLFRIAYKRKNILLVLRELGNFLWLLRHKSHRYGLGLIWEYSRLRQQVRYTIICIVSLICLYYLLFDDKVIKPFATDLW